MYLHWQDTATGRKKERTNSVKEVAIEFTVTCSYLDTKLHVYPIIKATKGAM